MLLTNTDYLIPYDSKVKKKKKSSNTILYFLMIQIIFTNFCHILNTNRSQHRL